MKKRMKKRKKTRYFHGMKNSILDQEIKDALETIPNKSMGSNSNEFWFYPLKTHLFITVLIYIKDDFIHKKAINYLYQVKNYV
jgi:hypothetical protein